VNVLPIDGRQLVRCLLGVYSAVVLVLAAPGSLRAEDDLRLTVDPAMMKGAPGAPVTIVEFSDYQ
jgi:protein-disulfide isomerase